MKKISKTMTFQKKAKKTARNKNSLKKKKIFKDLANEDVKRHKGEFLDAKNIREGMLLLGCIIEIRSDCILMSLPGCLVGTVPLTNISRKYTEVIKNDIDNEETRLEQLFNLGAMFPCKVLKVECHISKKPSIILSIDPKDVNSNIKWQSLYSKMVLHTAVVSIEDHGYVMDTGIKDVQGFLPFNATMSNKLMTLGQVIPTYVIKLPSHTNSGNVITLASLDFENTYPEVSSDDVKLSAILPGAHVNTYISEVTQQFAYLKCLNYDACSCLVSAYNLKKNIKESAMVSGIVLYVHPITNVIYIHVGSLPTPKTFHSFFSLQKYDRIKDLKFYASHHHRLFFKYHNFLTYVKSAEVAEKPTFAYDSLIKNPLVPKARVVFLHYMDNLVQVTFKESMMKMKIVKLEEVQVGEIYEGTVKKHVENGIFVSICPGLSGFVRNSFCSDSFLTKPESLFPVGLTVKCRVLSIHPRYGLNLTCKESLISLPETNLLKSYEEAKKGKQFKGVIVKQTSEYMLVLFWNNVQGIVSTENIPTSSIYYVGQTISCFVIHSDPVNSKLKLSLTNPITSADKERKSLNTSEVQVKASIQNCSMPVFSEGKTYNAIIKKITAHQLSIVVEGGKKGRIHITQTGCSEKDAVPFKQFMVGLCLKVYILKEYENYIPSSLEITQKKKHLLECSLVYPPTFPFKKASNKPFLGFIKKVYESYASVWLSPYECGIIDFINLSNNTRDIRKLKKNLRIGQSIKVSLLATSSSTPKCKREIIGLVNPDISAPIVGKSTIGFLKEASLNTGLRLDLPHNYSGFVCPTNIHLSLQTLLEKISKWKFVVCHVLEVNNINKTCVLSIKKSSPVDRQIILAEQNLCAIPDNPQSISAKQNFHTIPVVVKNSTIPSEITTETIKQGMKINGRVKLFCESFIEVNIGHNLNGKVFLHRCDLYKCTMCNKVSEVLQTLTVDNVIEVIVENLSKNDFHILSLPGIINKDFQDDLRLVVKEDINWNEL